MHTKKNTTSANPENMQSMYKNNEDSNHPYEKPPQALHINEPIKKQLVSEKAKKRKYRIEILSAALLLIFMAIITWGQLNSFGSDPWVFFVLININAILMLVVLFLVARNIIRLLLERRRNIFGSRIRTRLVLAFFSISFIPILIMFLASNRILTTSVNYWFTGQVENSMQAALDVGHSFYDAASTRLKNQTTIFTEELIESPKETWPAILQLTREEKQFTLLGIMERTKNLTEDTFSNSLATQDKTNIQEDTQQTSSITSQSYTEQVWFANQAFSEIWVSIRHSINFNKINETGFDSLLWADEKSDYAIIALPIPHEPSLYIIAGERLGKGLLTQLDKISTGFQEYTELKNLKQPLKLSFSLILALLSLIVLFASIWLAFRLSREITEPILALAKGTKQLAQGDWNIQVTDKGQDELGQLVHSFNYMTNEIHKSQDRLQKLNWLIEENNLTLIERNQYIEAILEHITTGVATLDDKGTLITINKAVCDIFKIRAEQYEGLSFDMFLSDDHKLIIQEMYKFLQENPDKIWIREVELLVQEQYSKVLIQALPLPSFLREEQNLDEHNQDEQIICIEKKIGNPNYQDNLTHTKTNTSHNILSQNTRESQNNELLKEELVKEHIPKKNAYLTGNIILVIEDITALSQEQRLAAWREVARRIAHEIKNPLTPIKLSTERMKRKFGSKIDDPVFAQCTDLIIQEVARMQNMVTDFSNFAALPTIQLELADPMSILNNLTTLFKTSHSSISWEIIEKTKIPNVLLDKEALYRALFNILSNATDAIQTKQEEENSIARHATNNTSQPQKNHNTVPYKGRVEILCFTSTPQASSQRFVTIEILDNGTGINAEEAARLFEPYYSKKPTGTGLGLAIVRSIISDHGGTITAHKRQNGTCIRVNLPIYQSSKHAHAILNTIP